MSWAKMLSKGPRHRNEGWKCAVDLLKANNEMSASYYLDP